jgi:hypothetical protein
MKPSRVLASLLAVATLATPIHAVETARGVLPPGPAAPTGVTGWTFASGRDVVEVTTFLYVTHDATSMTLRMTPPDAAIRAVEVYANGTFSARLDGSGAVEGRKPDGFRHGDGPPVPLIKGLRKGLNRITLLPRYASDIEDAEGAPRPAWSGVASFATGRLVELPLMFRGLERYYNFQARLYQSLRHFDHEIRVGHPLEPQHALIRRMNDVSELRHVLARDRSVVVLMAEADRLYLESWRETGGGDQFLNAQTATARQVAVGWHSTEPLFVAHEIYRSARKKSSIYEALTDVALSKENLRNACAVLATRSGETVPEGLKSLFMLMQQDIVLQEALERQLALTAQDLTDRQAEILKAYPQWKERFLFAYHAVLRARKSVPPDYPSKPVVEHESRVITGYLDQCRALLTRDVAYGKILAELASTLLEPRAEAPGLPKRLW